MLISAFIIENFKAIRDPICIDFKPITLLFGPNSAGKSTIFQALHYANEIYERANVDPGETLIGGKSIDLGGFQNLVHNYDLTKEITLRFNMDCKNEDFDAHLFEIDIAGYQDYFSREDILNKTESAWVEITVGWNNFLKKPYIRKYETGINDNILVRIESDPNSQIIILSYFNFDHPIFMAEEENKKAKIEKEIMPLLGDIRQLLESKQGKGNNVNYNMRLQRSALPDWERYLFFEGNFLPEDEDSEEDIDTLYQAIGLLHTLIVIPGVLVRNDLRKLKYLGPLREVPARSYELSRSPDETRWASGLAAWDILYKADGKFIEEVNQWLSSEIHFNSGYRLEVKRFKELDISSPLLLALAQDKALDEIESIKEELGALPICTRVYLREESTNILVLPQDVGVGLSQLLPAIVLSLYLKNGIITIEQPELHIHPAFEVNLGDLFISQSKNQNVCFFIETHSEHLLLRLLRRIRETHNDELPPSLQGLTPDNLAIYYVINTVDGVKLSELKVDVTGDSLGEWPEGFFEERREELY